MHAKFITFVSGNIYIYATIRRRRKQCSESRPRIILVFTRPSKNSSDQMRIEETGIPLGSDLNDLSSFRGWDKHCFSA